MWWRIACKINNTYHHSYSFYSFRVFSVKIILEGIQKAAYNHISIMYKINHLYLCTELNNII